MWAASRRPPDEVTVTLDVADGWTIATTTGGLTGQGSDRLRPARTSTVMHNLGPKCAGGDGRKEVEFV